MHYPFWKKNSKPCGFFGCGSEKTGSMGSPLIPSSVRWAVQKSMSWTASGKGVWTYAMPKRELEDRWIANMQINLANDLVFATKGIYIYIHITYIQYIYIYIYNIYIYIQYIYIQYIYIYTIYIYIQYIFIHIKIIHIYIYIYVYVWN